MDPLKGEPSFRKPIFGAAWRYPDTDLRRLQRAGRRGLLRLAVLKPLTLGVMSLLAISLVYATSGVALFEASLIGTMAASICVLVFRGWMLGTFINGDGFKIVTLLATNSGHWRNGYCVEIRHTTWVTSGIPIAARSRSVVLSQNGGPDLMTHAYCGSIDGIFCSEKLDVLFQLLRRWSIPE